MSRLVTTTVLVAAIVVLTLPGAVFADPDPAFRFGFKALADQIPDVVGRPLEEEHGLPNGDTEQRTTTGRLAWSKAANRASFTDGSTTWVDGPFGVQAQPSGERFDWENADAARARAPSTASARRGAVLSDNLLVTWYGNPHTGLMGVLGQFEGADLARRLQRQANAYADFTDRRIVPAYELIAVVAQDNPGSDGLWRRREFPAVIDSMLEQARAHGFRLILDVQVGQSTVQDELEYLRPWLEQPDVYLALDPEFDMWKGQVPGEHIGHMTADEINHAIGFLEAIITANDLPPKVLIVHQFTQNMVPDKEAVGGSLVVDVVLDMDGFGAQWLKRDTWEMVMARPLQFAGIKLFYDQDPGLFSPGQVMSLEPVPSVVIYQ